VLPRRTMTQEITERRWGIFPLRRTDPPTTPGDELSRHRDRADGGVAEVLSGVAPLYGPPEREAAPLRVERGRGIVCAAHPRAAEAGAEILSAGGTAYDAAVAVAAALTVVEPGMSGIGGYGTVVVHDAATGASRSLDGCGPIPARLDPRVLRGSPGMRRGPAAISTPGALPAWEALHAAGGRLPWAGLLEPAIRLAATGCALSVQGAAALASVAADLPPNARPIFAPRGPPLAAGEILVQRELAETLRLVADIGSGALRHGPLARAVEDAAAVCGASLRAADLAAARVRWGPVLSLPLRGAVVVTSAPPATSFEALIALGIMDRLGAAPGPPGEPEVPRTAAVAAAVRRAFLARLTHAGDPDRFPPPLERLLSSQGLDELAAEADPSRFPGRTPPSERSPASATTTHFVVADAAGNVVTATFTLGGLFGSRLLVPGTGVWLNDSLAYAAWDPPGNPMEPRPGGRKLSGDAPVLVLRAGRPWLALGTPGGHTIPQTVAQVVMHAVCGASIEDAVRRPRLAWIPPGSLLLEPGAPREGLPRGGPLGDPVHLPRRMLSNVQAVELHPDGYRGVPDPRGEGAAAAG
jgi:gamma-glutamyltranspeptidase / glutathione hydrolase